MFERVVVFERVLEFNRFVVERAITLNNCVLFALVWQDTRDMLADGLTKGAVERTALHDAMNGYLKILHECKFWRPKHLLRD